MISTATSGAKKAYTFSAFHVPISSSIRQCTVAETGIGEMGSRISGGKRGIQLSFKIFTEYPSPITQRIPWNNSSRPCKMLRQVYEEDLGLVAFQKSEFGK
jgi:hypothetical protein